MKKVRYSIGKEFSRTPGPRFEHEGPNSGQKFRQEYFYPRLMQAIKNGEVIEVDLDGLAGIGTSFLEETFGGLIRENNLDINTIRKHITIKSLEEDYLEEDIQSYLRQADEQCQKV